MLRWFLSRRSTPKKEDLFRASREGHADEVRALVKMGANPNARAAFGETALMMAAQAGHIDIALALLEAGADFNAADSKGGVTPLFMASQNGHRGIVSLLLAAGADVNTSHRKGGYVAVCSFEECPPWCG